MAYSPILVPVVALVAWSILMCFWMMAARFTEFRRLGITFGNVIFVNGQYQDNAEWQALPDPVTPPAYSGTVTIPKSQALYEHELRHVNQYGRWGPFFHLGLPLFGVYEWDVILNGYQNAGFEKDAREYSGF